MLLFKNVQSINCILNFSFKVIIESTVTQVSYIVYSDVPNPTSNLCTICFIKYLEIALFAHFPLYFLFMVPFLTVLCHVKYNRYVSEIHA